MFPLFTQYNCAQCLLFSLNSEVLILDIVGMSWGVSSIFQSISCPDRQPLYLRLPVLKDKVLSANKEEGHYPISQSSSSGECKINRNSKSRSVWTYNTGFALY